jgi:hypothetical protein
MLALVPPWTDPTDTDFSRVRVFENGICHGYTAKGVQTKLLTDLWPNTQYKYEARTYDYAGNYNRTNITLYASTLADTTPPGTVTNLHVTARTSTSITWAWTDPADADFLKVRVYLNGVKTAYVAKGVQTYTATGLIPSTSYTIGILSYDIANNYNPRLVSSSSATPA